MGVKRAIYAQGVVVPVLVPCMYHLVLLALSLCAGGKDLERGSKKDKFLFFGGAGKYFSQGTLRSVVRYEQIAFFAEVPT